jgi:WD40 repeat protein
MSFEHHQDFITSIDFNANHPAKFLSADADGGIALWNLLKSTDFPMWSTSIGVGIGKVAWNIDGRHFAVGDSESRIGIWRGGFDDQKKSDVSTQETGPWNSFSEEDLTKFTDIITALSGVTF